MHTCSVLKFRTGKGWAEVGLLFLAHLSKEEKR